MSKKPANPRTTPKPEPDAMPPFEQALEQIQQIIDDVESGDVPLSESLDRYERGMKLLRHCRGVLDEAETKIKHLTLDELDATPADDDASS